MSSVQNNRYWMQASLFTVILTGLVVWTAGASRSQGDATAKAATPASSTSDAPAAKPDKAAIKKTDAKAVAAKDAKAKDAKPVKKLDLTCVPAIKWMPKPRPNAAAEAASPAKMKAYTETIPGAQPRFDVKFDMVPIRGGTFLMGSPESEKERGEDESPQHKVAVEPFWMGKCEVTWEEYELWGMELDLQRRAHSKAKADAYDLKADALLRPSKPYTDMSFDMGKDDCPAICMTQLAARVYCKWLSAKTGRFYRLPTEAEWEYACRAGTTTAYSFGDDPKQLGDHAWYFDNCDDKYHKVGQKKPNPWGLHDMHGNVSEWVLDQHIADFYKQAAGKLTKNPIAPVTKLYPCCVRGGSWDDEAPALRSAARRGSEEDWSSQDPQIPQSIWYHTDATFVGFRVVRPFRQPTPEECKLYEPDYEAVKEYLDAKGGGE